MTNAIFVCLIISVLCSCLVLISYYYNLLNDHLHTREDLINRNDSTFKYSMNNIESISYGKAEFIDVFDDGILSKRQRIKWGFYDLLICETGFKNDTVIRAAIVGKKNSKENSLALYVTNYDKPLKLSGKTKILGGMELPLGKTEQLYLNGVEGNSILLKGNQAKSEKKFPRIDKSIEVNTTGETILISNMIQEHPIIINSFNKETKIIDATEVNELRDITCKGNIVLKSNRTLKISHTAHLSDVIVYAPSVEILSGFTGNIQIVAKENVIVNEFVSLLYPSGIYLKNGLDSVTVDIKNNSTIAGGIVVDGETYAGALNRFLKIREKATVIGRVYCYGKTQLEGEVIGSVWTDKFFLKTKSSNYDNVILNGTINKDSLSKNFVELPLFKNDFKGKNYTIVKEF